jgi:gluconate 2-dehydrogenase gamma chain
MADKYLLWVLSDERMDPEEKEYIINGIGWVDETAEENFSKNFVKLTQAEREKLIGDVSKETWGRSWLGVILTFIFEALLSDPQYGGNTDEIGWDWLHHNPGQPRPTKKLLYPQIFETVE